MNRAFLVFLLLSNLAHTGFSQSSYKNVLIYEQSALGYAPCEPSIAISKSDPAYMVGGAVLKYVFISSDSGKTWKADKMKSRHGVYGDPCLLSDNSGKFYYFHLSDPSGRGWASPKLLDRIVCQYSTSNGKRWSRGSSIGFNHPKDQDKEWVCYDPINDRLIATWTQFDTYNDASPSCESNILLSTSKTGKQWSEAATLSTVPGNCIDDSRTAEGATSDVDNEGNIYTAWSMNGKIRVVIGYTDRASGQITGYSDEIVAVESLADWDFNIPGLGRANGMPIIKCDRSNGSNRGTLYINWADQRNGTDDTDIWMIKSTDKGVSWSLPTRVNDDASGKHQFFTWMDLDQSTGYIYTIFYDRRNYSDNQTDVYLAVSRDGGNSFQNERISQKPFTAPGFGFFGDYNNISVVNGVVRPIWTHYENGKQSIWTALINDFD